jgi:hypothetical protein
MTIAEDEIQIDSRQYTGTTWFFLFCLILGGISLAGAIYEDVTSPPPEAPIEEAPIDTTDEDETLLLLLLLSAAS